MAASTAVQFIFGVLARFLLDDFAISRSRLGLLTTLAFLIGALGSIPAGSLVDRIGGRRVQIGSLVLIALATATMAAAPNFGLLLLGSALTGGALATCNPTTNKLIAAHIEPGQRGVVMGTKQAGVQAGAFLIGALIPTIAIAWGWRAALLATVAVPAIAAAATALFVPPDPVGDPPQVPRRRRPLEAGVWWLAAYAALMGAGVAAFGTYVPLYAQETVGMSLRAAGLITGVVGVVGIVARIAWAWSSERTGRFSTPLTLLGAGSIVAIVLVLSADDLGSPALWAGAILFGATAISWNAIGMLAVLAEVDQQSAGRASGLVQTGFYAGFVASPTLFGYSIDVTGTYQRGWAGIAVAFVLAALVAVVRQRMS
jgi:predicted MFS family arabinose efflux permease